MGDSTTLQHELREIRRRTERLVSGLSGEQLASRPDPAKWSIAECLAHLNMTAAMIQPKIAATIAKGKAAKVLGQGPFSPGALGRLLIWMAEPPPKFRFRAPKKIRPRVDHGDALAVVAEFMRVQDEWERQLGESAGLDQKKLKMVPPFPGLPPMRLSAQIPWMLAHQRRHLWQAENIRRRLPAPTGPEFAPVAAEGAGSSGPG